MSVEDDLRTAAKILKWDDREWPDLAARLEALADRRAQEEAVIEAAVAWNDDDAYDDEGYYLAGMKLEQAVAAYRKEPS